MFWWHHASQQVVTGRARCVGLITTNSLTMVFNRRVVQSALNQTTHLKMAIPDHPWVDGANGAAVRIAMTVLAAGEGEGVLSNVTDEQPGDHGEVSINLRSAKGVIHADLKVGANVASAVALSANQRMSNTGYLLGGRGFVLTHEEAEVLRELPKCAPWIFPLFNGNDITGTPRGYSVIDAHGITAEELRIQAPKIWQRLQDTVWPERQINADPKVRANWWLFRRSNEQLRESSHGLSRLIVTVETAKHRVFGFIDGKSRPEHKLVVIASTESFHLGALSSQLHGTWALATGGYLGVGNDPVYSKSRCFETFPFPDEDTGLTPDLRSRIATLAEQIDAHRKKVLAQAAEDGTKLTLTGLYNVLEALREGRALNAKEKAIHTHGLVGVLKDLHDELDATVLQAYGWADLSATEADTPELLTRLVALNAKRAAEEKAGTVRWLRPAFQNPAAKPEAPAAAPQNEELFEGEAEEQVATATSKKTSPKVSKTASADTTAQPWPATLPDQVRAVAAVLSAATAPLALEALESHFKGRGPWKKSLPRILETLEALGRAKQERDAWRGQT